MIITPNDPAIPGLSKKITDHFKGNLLNFDSIFNRRLIHVTFSCQRPNGEKVFFVQTQSEDLTFTLSMDINGLDIYVICKPFASKTGFAHCHSF